MKVCSYCGNANDDSRNVCEVCGALLPETKAAAKMKKKGLNLNLKPRAVKAIAGTLAAVTVAGGGAYALMGGTSRQVAQAIDKNQTAITEEISQLPQLNAAVEHLEELNDGGAFTVRADITTDAAALSGNMDYDRKDKALAGSLVYENVEQELDVKFDFASDNKEFTLAADRYTADIYGFKLTEFAEFYSKTPLALFFPLTNKDDEPNVEFFKKMDFEKAMEEKYGESWKNFRKSLSYEELNPRDMEIGGAMVNVRAYEITWDTSAASRLISAMLGQEEGLLDDFIELFKFLEPDCRFYVNDEGYVAAVDFVAAGNKCVLKFEGEENPWDRCTLSSLSIAGGEGAISGQSVLENGNVSVEFCWDGEAVFRLDYEDSTGSFDMEAVTGTAEWYLEGALTAAEGGTQLTLGGRLPEHGRVDVTLELVPLEKEPELMDDRYVDLMDMDASNWQRLLIDINNSN